jgi:signal transduction histidine kinase
VLETKKPVLRTLDSCSLIAVPLVIRDQLLGVLVLGSSTPTRQYDTDDLRFAEALAERAALAIENGRLYKTAVRATRLRDELLGIVAHDLRNPLAAIQLQAAAMRPKASQAERRSTKPRENILRAVDRMGQLIGDLLDLTTIESGKLSIERAALAPRQLVADAVETQRTLAEGASQELKIDVIGKSPDVWGDQTRLLQVLENLVGNAIKFTPAGGRVTVGAAPRETEVLFWVADTGAGIAPEDLPHVFDRFWQAKKGSRKGAGLGLPIAKGIVESHGGRLWVESTIGRGSVFFFTVPQAPPMEASYPGSTPPTNG